VFVSSVRAYLQQQSPAIFCHKNIILYKGCERNWVFFNTCSLGRVNLKSSHLSHVESSGKDVLIKDPVKFHRGKPQHLFAFQIILMLCLEHFC